MKRLYVALACFLTFLILIYLVTQSVTFLSWDRELLERFARLRGGTGTAFALGARQLFDFNLTIIWGVILGAWFFMYRGMDRAFRWPVLVVGILFLSRYEKLVLVRPRPESFHWLVSVSGFSFPSAHALRATGILLGFVLLGWERWTSRTRGILLGTALFGAGAVSLAELLLGVNYLSDVLAGVSLAAAWVLALSGCWALSESRNRMRSR